MRELLARLFGRRPKVVVLFVEYDRGLAGGTEQAFATLERYLAPVGDCLVSLIRIDNRDEGKGLTRQGRLLTVGGDNRYREFSGWQKGLALIDQLGLASDLVLFVNDMFLAPGESFLKDYASRGLFERSLTERAIIGRIDTTGEQFSAYGYDLSRWVCTNCFLAPKAAVDRLANLVTVADNLNDFLTADYPGPGALFRPEAPMNEAYKAWLTTWLTSRWHSRFSIEAGTWELFRTKVRNILNEALLTARFAQAGFAPQSYGDKKYY